MDCKEIKNLIPVYLDDELEHQQLQYVRDHLASCPACQKEADSLKQAWQMLTDVEEIEPAPNYISRFWTRLSQKKSWSKKVLEGVKSWLPQRKLAPVIVTACLLIVVGVIARNSYQPLPGNDMELASLSPSEIEMVENIELAENLDLLEDLEFLEDLEIIEDLELIETPKKITS